MNARAQEGLIGLASIESNGSLPGLEPNLEHARGMSLMAHGVVIKLKELGLPESLNDELGHLSTDLGDLWGAQKELAERLEGMLESAGGWHEIGDCLVDLKASIEHIDWHVKSVKRPLNKITRFAYQQNVSD